MRPRASLFMQVLAWFFLSLLVLAGILAGLFRLQFRAAPDSPLAGLFGTRMLGLGSQVARALADAPRERWDRLLADLGTAYRVELWALDPLGRRIAGSERPLPPEVVGRLREHARFLASPPPAPPDAPRLPPPAAPPPLFRVRTVNPTRYFLGTPILLAPDPARPPLPALLVAGSASFTGHGLFLDPAPWVLVAAVTVAVAALLWLPLVRRITRPLAQVTRAASQIARGRFDVRLPERRRDEIGELSRAINKMAARLDGTVKAQKRFLGDAAHELASPLARIQLGLGILERRLGEGDPRLREVIGEVEQMSALVAELLSFARADVGPAPATLSPVPLAPLVRKVVERERAEGTEVRIEVDEALAVLGEPEILARALANLVRNAVRYAGAAGPITVAARRVQGEIEIEVRDSGPGVPEEALPRLFEPFYRPEASRGRETGGAGLGLAIVKTCVAACRGTVAARNLSPAGLAVTITLQAAG